MDSQVSQNQKTVFLVDDNEELRTIVAALFVEVPNYILRCFESATRALIAIEEETLEPQVILLDIEMPGMNGLDAIAHFRKSLPLVKIIILSSFESDRYIQEAFARRVNGYLLKPFKLNEVIAAIEAVLRDELPTDPRITKKLVEMAGFVHPLAADYGLTRSEIAVFRCLVNGLRRKQIANELNLSIDTVKAYLKNGYKKLGVENAAGAVAKIVREHLLDI